MKNSFVKLSMIILIMICVQFTYAQVGIGTTTPRGALDVNSTTQGIVPPAVALTNITLQAPVVNPQGGVIPAGTFVWNTNTAGIVPNNVSPGIYYWNGTRWVSVAGGLDWSIIGNAGTTAGTHFLGTTDNQDLVLKTNNVEHFRMSQNQTVINDNSIDHDFRVESNNEQEMFLIDANRDRIGIKEATPATDLHLGSTTGTIRIESLNSTNNTNNNGIDPSVVMVDANGDLFIRDKVDDFPVDASDTGTGTNVFMAAPMIVDSVDGEIVVATAYTKEIIITRTTLIEVAFWTSVNIQPSGGAAHTTDNKPRLFGGLVTETGTGTDIVYSANSYTNAAAFGSGTIMTGFFTVGGNGFITLPAGTHTIELVVFAEGGRANGFVTEGVRATFGANDFNRFQIVYHN